MSVDLRVDWCSHEAAKYAVEKWHYSRSLPAAPVKIGVWENNKFVGVVLFSRGASYNIGNPYGLRQTECCELTRIALTRHASPVTQIMRLAIKKLQEISPGLRLLISYADTNQGHLGIIYQASNWIYTGEISDRAYYMLGQNLIHGKTVYSKYGTQAIEWLRQNVDPGARMEYTPPKHKYLYPLDRAMRKQIAPLAKPYPKRESCGQSVEGDTVGDQPSGAGSIPADRSNTHPVRVE